MELSKEVLEMIFAGYDIIGYNHTTNHLNKIHEKFEESAVQTQLKTCMDAYTEYTRNLEVYHHNPDTEALDLYGQMNQSHWWVFMSMTQLVALIDDEYVVKHVEWENRAIFKR